MGPRLLFLAAAAATATGNTGGDDDATTLRPDAAAGSTNGILLLRHDVRSADPLAVCNDGSPPVYYASPPTNNSSGWMIILSGQGNQQMPWCFPPDESTWEKGDGIPNDCWWGAPKSPAPPPAPPAPNMTLPCGTFQAGSHCIYSSNCTTNPTLCDYGKIIVPQCTFDNWLGDATRQLGTSAHPHTAHYRGQRMLNATISQAARDLLSPSSRVIVAGSDGGGNLLYIQADRIRDMIATGVSVESSVLDFMAVPIEGFWVHWDGYTSGFGLQQAIVGRNDAHGSNRSSQCIEATNESSCDGLKGCGKWSQPLNRTTGRPIDGAQGSCSSASDMQVAGGNAWKFMNFSGAVNPRCVADIDPTGTNETEHWRCLLAEVAGRYIESRIFPIEQLWGVFGSFCLVNAEFVSCDTGYNCGKYGYVNGAGFTPGMKLHCDKGGRVRNDGGSMHACAEYGWGCSESDMTAFVMPYQAHVRNTFAAMPFLHTPGNGAFMHSCHTGNEDMLGVFWNTIRVLPSNLTAQQKLARWVNSPPTAPPQWEPPCLWNHTFTPTRVFKHNCNPSCPNIAY